MENPDQLVKVAVFTGAILSIGLRTASTLAPAPVQRVLAFCNSEVGRTAESLICEWFAIVTARLEMLDRTKIVSVTVFSQQIGTAREPIDGLTNGVMALPKLKVSVGGFERPFGISYLSLVVLITRSLALSIMAKARVVQLSGIAYIKGKIWLGDLNDAKDYGLGRTIGRTRSRC